MTARRLSLLLISILLLAVPLQATAGVVVIVKASPLTNVPLIVALLHGTLLDSISEANMLLVDTPSLPLLTPILQMLGVQWIEANTSLALPPVGITGEITPLDRPDWYKLQPAMQLIRSAEAHGYSTGRGVVIADINSQVDYSHPALIGHLTSGYDFVATKAPGNTTLNQSSAGFLDQSSAGFLDQSSAGFLDQYGLSILNQSSAGFLDGHGPAYSHGTLCAGLMAVVAPDAMIMPLRAFDDNGSADVFTLAKAIRHAAQNNAQVVNMSFGTMNNSKAMKDSVDYALSRGVVLVASAGNDNTSVPQYPAAFAGVVATAATDITDTKASFSNYGSFVFIDAPGVNIISAYPGNKYSMVSGTSFSAPIAAATVALIRSLHVTGATTALAASSVDVSLQNPGYNGQLGYGRIDASQAAQQ